MNDREPLGSALASFMRSQKRAIIGSWLERVRALPSASRLDGTALAGVLPGLLDEMADAAHELAVRGRTVVPAAMAERHALARLGEGFDLTEVMLEYSFLRECLLDAWQRAHVEGRLREGIPVLNKIVDAVASASVEGYTRARDKTLHAVDRISAAALGSGSLEEILASIAHALVETAEAVDTALILLREDSTLRGTVAAGLDPARVRKVRVRIDDLRGAGAPDAPGEPWTLYIPQADDLVRRAVPDVRAQHVVPLVDARELLGAVHLSSRTAHEFSAQDRQLFEAIGNRAAAAIRQKLLRQNAERRAAELETVIESIPAAIFIGNEAGITLSNRKGLEMAGCSSLEELEGPTDVRVLRLQPRDPETHERVPPDAMPFAKALRGEPSTRDLLVRDATTGADAYVHAVAAPIREGDKVVGAVAVDHDITDLMKAQERIKLSEQRLTLAVEATRLGTWDWDIHRGELAWSPRCREIHGVADDERVTYARFLQCLHPDDRPEVEHAVEAATRAGSSGDYHAEYRVLTPDGEVRTVVARGRSFFDPAKANDQAVRMIGTALDVTEQRHEQEAQRFLSEAGPLLASSLDFRETLVRIAKLAVPHLADWCGVEIVLDGKIEQLALEHVDPSKVQLARNLRQLYPPLPDAPRGLTRVLRTGESEIYEEISDSLLGEHARDEGHAELLRRLELRSAMIVPMIARGRSVGALSFALSGSGRRYTRRDLGLAEELARRAALALDNARLFQDSQAAVSARERILGIVSHDLRNPLGTIIMGTAVARQLEAGAHRGIGKQLEAIERSARRMEHLIEDLLETTRIQTGRLTVRREEHLAASLVDEALEAVETSAREKEIQLRCENALGSVRLLCDRDRILQVLTNLLGNSIKFCRPGETVTLRAEPAAGAARFVVADTGPGIQREDLARIFEPYWSAAAHVRSGTGLGLFIAKGIVEAHGGRIDVSSEVGVGTTVAIQLPVARPAPVEAETPPPAPAPRIPPEELEALPPSRREALWRSAVEGDQRAVMALLSELPDGRARDVLVDLARSLRLDRIRDLLGPPA